MRGDVKIALMGGHLNQFLFDQRTVNYRRLRGLRTEARAQVEHAIKVEQLIAQSIEALEATR